MEKHRKPPGAGSEPELLEPLPDEDMACNGVVVDDAVLHFRLEKLEDRVKA